MPSPPPMQSEARRVSRHALPSPPEASPARARRRRRIGCTSAQAPPIDVDLVERDAGFFHRDQRHDGECFVDLPEIDIARLPSRAIERLADRRHRRRRKLRRLLRVRSLRRRCVRSPLACSSRRSRHSTSAAAPSEIADAFAAVTVPPSVNAGFKPGSFPDAPCAAARRCRPRPAFDFHGTISRLKRPSFAALGARLSVPGVRVSASRA